MDLLLGIDLGTSYFKLGLFDRGLAMRGLGRVAVPARTGGYRHELAAGDFWETLQTGLSEALATAGARTADIGAVSWSSQANSFLLLDNQARPLTPLIMWPDSRAADVPDAIEDLSRRPDFMATTGMGSPLGRGSAVTKLAWLRRNEPALYSKGAHILTISDYLAYCLSGCFRGDAGTASLLGLMNQHALAWWPEALQAAGIAIARLSTPMRPGALLGCVTAEAANPLGLSTGTAVVAGTLDHHAAALGAGLGERAAVSESTGTVLACVAQAAGYHPCAGTCTLPGVAPGTYAVLAYDNNGAGVLEWYQRNHAAGLSFADLDRLAAAVPPDCDGLVARPLAHSKPGLEGFDNRRDIHGPGHYARAIMTSVADTLGTLLDRLSPSGRPNAVVATGGGAHSPFWLELKRQRLGIDIFPAACREPACRGAAMLARHP